MQTVAVRTAVSAHWMGLCRKVHGQLLFESTAVVVRWYFHCWLMQSSGMRFLCSPCIWHSDRCKAFQSQLQAEAVQIALCAQIKAFACQTVLGCCAGSDAVVGEWLTEWVRDRVYGANAPVPSLPIAACQAEVGDKKSEQAFCDQCVPGILFCVYGMLAVNLTASVF